VPVSTPLPNVAHVLDSTPPGAHFAYLTLSAWGDPSPVGTLARLDGPAVVTESDAPSDAELLCSGVCRLRVLHMDEGRRRARVQLFHDAPGDAPAIAAAEARVVDAMTQIVHLSLKISRDGERERREALEATLKRVEAFCEGEIAVDGVEHVPENADLGEHVGSFVEGGEAVRAEVLSFIVTDLLSISYMERRNVMLATDTAERLAVALKSLEPYIKELAAKGAIVSALGLGGDDAT